MSEPKLNVAVVTTYPPGQGSLNEYGYHFVRFLRQKPEINTITVLADQLPAGNTYQLETEPACEVAPLSIISCWKFGAWRNFWNIWRTLKRTKPDVVVFNLQFATFGSTKIAATLGLCTPLLVKLSGVPTVVLLHNLVETVDLHKAGISSNRLMQKIIRFFGSLITRLILRSDLVAVTVPKYVELLREKYRADNVMLAPHGSFYEAPTPTFETPPGPLQIMTFGKFGTYKKIEPLIEAFKILQTQNHPAMELVIAGTDSPNAPGYLAQMQQQYRQVKGLHFTGYVPEEEVPGMFRQASIVIFPYTSTTGSSGVLHQAGEYGKAVVLPHIGDFGEIIKEEGYTGQFFEPGDVNSLAQAIAILIDDPEQRRNIGMQNYLAARGLPMADVIDWYLLHIQTILK